jgi:hypothetical protein
MTPRILALSAELESTIDTIASLEAKLEKELEGAQRALEKLEQGAKFDPRSTEIQGRLVRALEQALEAVESSHTRLCDDAEPLHQLVDRGS